MGNHNEAIKPPKGAARPRTQGDGRKYLAHLVTGLLATVLSVGGVQLAHLGGSHITTTVTKVAPATGQGFCAYFGPDGMKGMRFQVSPAGPDGKCSKGTFVSVVPR